MSDLLGLMLHQAVAEGAVMMVASSEEGTPEHKLWTEVAGKAVPLAAEFLEGAKARHPELTIADESGVSAEAQATQDEMRLKQERLAQIEAEAARLRQELGE
ncbi:MAG TPA: hypothetical protein VF401_02825 [Candidatus Saccharimonadales bacterium]